MQYPVSSTSSLFHTHTHTNYPIIYQSLCLFQTDLPSKPTASDIKATQIRITWTPPNFGGDSFIIGYIVEYKADSGKKWTKVNDLNKTTDTSIVANNLLERTRYQFRVSAENQIGLKSCSKLSVLYRTLGR